MKIENNSNFAELISTVEKILRNGNDVEIKSCKEGYKVLEVQRKRALTIINTKGNDKSNG